MTPNQQPREHQSTESVDPEGISGTGPGPPRIKASLTNTKTSATHSDDEDMSRFYYNSGDESDSPKYQPLHVVSEDPDPPDNSKYGLQTKHLHLVQRLSKEQREEMHAAREKKIQEMKKRQEELVHCGEMFSFPRLTNTRSNNTGAAEFAQSGHKPEGERTRAQMRVCVSGEESKHPESFNPLRLVSPEAVEDSKSRRTAMETEILKQRTEASASTSNVKHQKPLDKLRRLFAL